MNSKKIFLLIIIGLISIGSGVFLIASDYKNLRDNYTKLYYNVSRQLTPNEINEVEPQNHTPEKLKSDLKMAEEYLRQNSYESIRKALDIYNKVLSFSKDIEIIQLAKYGLSYALFRLNDEVRSLQILRELKKEKIFNPILEEEIYYLLGKILLLRGHEDEGRSILQTLLAKTDSSDLKSRIHVAFGDFYYLKKQYKKAKKSYLIALEYNPDNLHAGINKENLIRKKNFIPFEHEIYDQLIFTKLLEKETTKDTKKQVKKEKQEVAKEPKEEQKKDTKKDLNERIEALNRKFDQSVLLLNKGEISSANNLLIEIEKEANGIFIEEKETIKDTHKNRLYDLLEKVYYHLGEILEKQNQLELAKSYYDKVLENPSISLDQASLVKKGILYFKESQYKQAYRTFKRAIDIDPTGKFVDKAKEWLQETEKILQEQER